MRVCICIFVALGSKAIVNGCKCINIYIFGSQFASACIDAIVLVNKNIQLQRFITSNSENRVPSYHILSRFSEELCTRAGDYEHACQCALLATAIATAVDITSTDDGVGGGNVFSTENGIPSVNCNKRTA